MIERLIRVLYGEARAKEDKAVNDIGQAVRTHPRNLAFNRFYLPLIVALGLAALAGIWIPFNTQSSWDNNLYSAMTLAEAVSRDLETTFPEMGVSACVRPYAFERDQNRCRYARVLTPWPRCMLANAWVGECNTLRIRAALASRRDVREYLLQSLARVCAYAPNTESGVALHWDPGCDNHPEDWVQVDETAPTFCIAIMSDDGVSVLRVFAVRSGSVEKSRWCDDLRDMHSSAMNADADRGVF